MLWKQLLFRKLAQLFFFSLFCLFAIYILIDFSIHGVKLLSSNRSNLALYYLHLFSQHWDLFVSLSFLLASLKTLLDLSAHLELVALQMAGLSRKQLLTPLFFFASLLSLSCYANSQWLIHPPKTFKPKKVYNIALDDDSELIYQTATEQELFDVFWIQSSNELWHMKYFNIATREGRWVDHFLRGEQQFLEKAESFDRLYFPTLPWNSDIKLQRFIPFEYRSLSTLFQEASASTAHKDSALSHLHYKCAMPLLPCLILLTIAPLTLRFSRTRSTFLIVASALFAFIGFATLMDAMLILGENRVFAPTCAIWIPFAVATLFTLPTFLKMR